MYRPTISNRAFRSGLLGLVASLILPGSRSAEAASQMDNICKTIRAMESGGNYTEHTRAFAVVGANGSGNPSGAYQFIRSTWQTYSGFAEAYLAPPAIQDERARKDVQTLLSRVGTVEWIPVAWYVGPTKALQIKAGTVPLSWVPNPAFNTLSVGEYQARWMRFYAKLPADPLAINGPVDTTPLAPAVRGVVVDLGALNATKPGP